MCSAPASGQLRAGNFKYLDAVASKCFICYKIPVISDDCAGADTKQIHPVAPLFPLGIDPVSVPAFNQLNFVEMEVFCESLRKRLIDILDGQLTFRSFRDLINGGDIHYSAQHGKFVYIHACHNRVQMHEAPLIWDVYRKHILERAAFIRKQLPLKRFIMILGLAILIAAVFRIPAVSSIVDGTHGRKLRLPLVTWLLILSLCLFNSTIMRTRLGQKFRAVGQSQTVANASGIDVDRTRVIAIMISTVLAGWGQIVFMQSDGIGTFQTYAAHEQVGLYAGAAILVGGASIDRATNLQALIGTFLFHSLFITAQSAASTLFGDSAVGEYFRAFLSYGVIAVALIMYAWRSAKQKKAGQLDLSAQRAAK